MNTNNESNERVNAFTEAANSIYIKPAKSGWLPNVPTETHATKTPSDPGQPAQTGGVSSPVLCSAGSVASDKHALQQSLMPLDSNSIWKGFKMGLLRVRSIKLLNILVKIGFPLDQVGRFIVKTDNRGSWRHEFNFWLRIPLLHKLCSA